MVAGVRPAQLANPVVTDSMSDSMNISNLAKTLQVNLRSIAKNYPALNCLDAATAMPTAGWRVIVGLSGGSDSLALLLAARELFDSHLISALHVDHGLQASSGRSAEAVVELCASLGITCTVRKVTVSRSGNLEQAARDARFESFSEAMSDSPTMLLLAHHQQDSAETVLMRLLRGRRAVDVPVLRQLADGWLLRPLLSVHRQQLDAVVAEAGHLPIEDPSNADERFDRNWLRRSVLPALQRRIPQLNAILSEQGRRHRATQELLATLMSARSEDDAAEIALPANASGRVLSVASLESIGRHATIALRAWLHSAGVYDFSDRQLEELWRQARAGASSGSLNGANVAVRLWRERLYLEAKQCVFSEADALWPTTPLRLTDGSLTLDHGALSWAASQQAKQPDAQQDQSPHDFHTMPAGVLSERVILAGRSGSRTLSEVLAEAQVPPWRRRGYPLIMSNGGLVEIAGVATACRIGEQPASVKFESMWRPFVVAG